MPENPLQDPAPLSILEQLDRCTVHIGTDTGTGTGFFYGFMSPDGNHHAPAIVTNNHVIDGATRFEIVLSVRNPAGELQHIPVSRKMSELTVIRHPGGQDICAIAIAPLTEELRRQGYLFEAVFLRKDLIPTPEQLDELQPVSRLLMIGYPNGIWDRVNNKAVFRSGITATHPRLDYSGTPNFLIDAAVFPGSSGSPVVLYEDGIISTKDGWGLGASRLYLLGIVHRVFEHQTIDGELRLVEKPIQKVVVPSVNVPNNLGICHHSKALNDIEKVIFAKPFGGNPYGAYTVKFN